MCSPCLGVLINLPQKQVFVVAAFTRTRAPDAFYSTTTVWRRQLHFGCGRSPRCVLASIHVNHRASNVLAKDRRKTPGSQRTLLHRIRCPAAKNPFLRIRRGEPRPTDAISDCLKIYAFPAEKTNKSSLLSRRGSRWASTPDFRQQIRAEFHQQKRLKLSSC